MTTKFPRGFFHELAIFAFACSVAHRILKKREGIPEMGMKPLKGLRGYRASNRGALIEALRGLEKHPRL